MKMLIHMDALDLERAPVMAAAAHQEGGATLNPASNFHLIQG